MSSVVHDDRVAPWLCFLESFPAGYDRVTRFGGPGKKDRRANRPRLSLFYVSYFDHKAMHGKDGTQSLLRPKNAFFFLALAEHLGHTRSNRLEI